MILMSEKMTSQKKLGEIKSVPYNKPLRQCKHGCKKKKKDKEKKRKGKNDRTLIRSNLTYLN
jgi:hypothetical protein